MNYVKMAGFWVNGGSSRHKIKRQEIISDLFLLYILIDFKATLQPKKSPLPPSHNFISNFLDKNH